MGLVTQTTVDEAQLQRLMATGPEGIGDCIEPVNLTMVRKLAEELPAVNRFNPAMLDMIARVFLTYWKAEDLRFYFGDNQSILFVATPWTMNQMLLDMDPKWNAAKAAAGEAFWKRLDLLSPVVDEIGYKPGRDWRFPPLFSDVAYSLGKTGAVTYSRYVTHPVMALDDFESDRLVFRFWWD